MVLANYDADTKYVSKDFVWEGRCYYAINPHGTDTGRCASTESHFNCGLQIQNIKRDGEGISIKEMFEADDGFYVGEADYKQNETWYQAYTSGDTNLIKAIEDVTRDFHARNASSFFGVPYDCIVCSKQVAEGIWEHKTLDKVLRDLSKRTNHGASYNMAAGVLLDTMGIDNAIRAKALLGLPKNWTLIRVCQYLLDGFDNTYPVVRGENYTNIISEVRTTGMMRGPTGWTRVCFDDPGDSKRAMNKYAAHRSQSPAAVVLNKAFVRVFNEVWLPNKNDFKLLAQIHDSVLFQYRIGRTDLPRKVADCMAIRTPITDIFGITRSLCVGVDLKGESSKWSELKGIK